MTESRLNKIVSSSSRFNVSLGVLEKFSVVTSLYRSLCLCQRILRVEGVHPESSRYKFGRRSKRSMSREIQVTNRTDNRQSAY